MRWFFGTFAVVTAVLFLSFIAWIATRITGAEAANYYVGQVMIYDLCAVAVILAYSGFVGAFHLWEKLTGRMEAEAAADRDGDPPPGSMASIVAHLRGRFVPVVLVVAAATLASRFVPHLPHEHQVELQLDDARAITRVEVAWMPRGDMGDARDGELVRTGAWRFAAGTAPPSLHSSVSLPDGRYGVDVTVERGDTRQAFHRLITLGDAESITVPLR